MGRRRPTPPLHAWRGPGGRFVVYELDERVTFRPREARKDPLFRRPVFVTWEGSPANDHRSPFEHVPEASFYADDGRRITAAEWYGEEEECPA